MTLDFELPACEESALHRLDARWKLAAFGLLIVTTACLRSLGPAIAALAFAIALAVSARLSFHWLRFRIGALAFALLPLVLLLSFLQGVPGIWLAILLTVRATAIALIALVLIATTPMPKMLQAANSMRLPAALTQIAMLSYRFLFLFADELRRLRRAVRLRGFRAGMNRHSYRTIGHAVGTIVLHSAERAETVAQAMRSRGFDGQFRTFVCFRTNVRDVVFFSVTAMTAFGLAVWELSC